MNEEEELRRQQEHFDEIRKGMGLPPQELPPGFLKMAKAKQELLNSLRANKNTARWVLVSYDTFEGEWYDIEKYHTEEEVIAAAKEYIAQQSGGSLDNEYHCERPDGSHYRITPHHVGLKLESKYVTV